MALPPSGTFHYLTTVPAEAGQDCFPWPTQLAESFNTSGNSLFDHRLVGYIPSLWISEEEVIPDATGERTATKRSLLTLRSHSRSNATYAEVSFQIDGELTKLLQPGDVLHLSHSCMWGTGLSLLRQNQLVFAVGAILGLPLGRNIRAKMPEDIWDQIKKFESVPYESRGKQPLCVPIEFHVGNEMRSILGGTSELGEYEIWVEGGWDISSPSGDAFAAISAKGLCEFGPAVACAKLLIKGGEMKCTKWLK
ncbi:MAG: hypothetical protein PVS2B2_15540 [Candidatus Acidiferrum sp.]